MKSNSNSGFHHKEWMTKLEEKQRQLQSELLVKRVAQLQKEQNSLKAVPYVSLASKQIASKQKTVHRSLKGPDRVSQQFKLKWAPLEKENTVGINVNLLTLQTTRFSYSRVNNSSPARAPELPVSVSAPALSPVQYLSPTEHNFTSAAGYSPSLYSTLRPVVHYITS